MCCVLYVPGHRHSVVSFAPTCGRVHRFFLALRNGRRIFEWLRRPNSSYWYYGFGEEWVTQYRSPINRPILIETVPTVISVMLFFTQFQQLSYVAVSRGGREIRRSVVRINSSFLRELCIAIINVTRGHINQNQRRTKKTRTKNRVSP